jgi:serine/threonine protein kinase
MIIDKKYELLEKLSEGSFGQVYKGKHVRTGELVAIKMERKNGSTSSSLKNEAKI